jgi:hypothetical protein
MEYFQNPLIYLLVADQQLRKQGCKVAISLNFLQVQVR